MGAAAGDAPSGGAAQHVPLAALEAKLDEVLEACGLDRDASMTPLQKLTTLEVRHTLTTSKCSRRSSSVACILRYPLLWVDTAHVCLYAHRIPCRMLCLSLDQVFTPALYHASYLRSQSWTSAWSPSRRCRPTLLKWRSAGGRPAADAWRAPPSSDCRTSSTCASSRVPGSGCVQQAAGTCWNTCNGICSAVSFVVEPESAAAWQRLRCVCSACPGQVPPPVCAKHLGKCNSNNDDAQSVPQEARVQRALERAAAPVFRKHGKPPMPRSTVHKRTVTPEDVMARPRDADLDAFLQLELS